MKTTLEISDHILNRAKRLARQRNTTLRNLTEQGLLHVVEQTEARAKIRIKPVTFKGRGLSPEFKGAEWSHIRREAQ